MIAVIRKVIVDMKKDLKKLLDLKNKYNLLHSSLRNKINNMNDKDINKLLMDIHCPYSYEKDSYFQIEEGEEKNSNCTWDTYYQFKCHNCKTKDQCYHEWKYKKLYNKGSIVDFLMEMIDE